MMYVYVCVSVWCVYPVCVYVCVCVHECEHMLKGWRGYRGDRKACDWGESHSGVSVVLETLKS